MAFKCCVTEGKDNAIVTKNETLLTQTIVFLDRQANVDGGQAVLVEGAQEDMGAAGKWVVCSVLLLPLASRCFRRHQAWYVSAELHSGFALCR